MDEKHNQCRKVPQKLDLEKIGHVYLKTYYQELWTRKEYTLADGQINQDGRIQDATQID